jgi:hypothetical protein
MIDLKTEKGIRLAEAARLVPPSRGARSTHISTVLRWIVKGARAPAGGLVRLEAVRLGGKWITSAEAVQRFCEKLTPDFEGAQDLPTPRTPGRRRKASERAEKELARLGI